MQLLVRWKLNLQGLLMYVDHLFVASAFHSSLVFLTAAMIHWTDQVKEALTDHKPGQSVLKKGWGPLQELDLWKSRAIKLLDIEKQLRSPEVKHVLSILQISKSVYVQRFLRLTKETQVGII